jgi:hypothetical protein
VDIPATVTVASDCLSFMLLIPGSVPSPHMARHDSTGSFLDLHVARPTRVRGKPVVSATCRGLGRLPTPRPEDRQFWLDALGIEEAWELAGPDLAGRLATHQGARLATTFACG